MNNRIDEKSTTIIFIIISIIVAILLSQKSTYFLANFAYYWLPQAVVFILLFIFRVRLAVITGTAIALTLSLIGYSLFKDAMAWIGYVFIIPAGFLTSLVYGLTIKSKLSTPFSKVIIYSIVYNILGIGFVQFILCSTVMYCG